MTSLENTAHLYVLDLTLSAEQAFWQSLKEHPMPDSLHWKEPFALHSLERGGKALGS